MINGWFLTEAIHRRGPCRSFEAVQSATPAGAGWINCRRLLQTIGTIPAEEAEANSLAALETKPMAASLHNIGLRKTQRGSPIAPKPIQQLSNIRGMSPHSVRFTHSFPQKPGTKHKQAQETVVLRATRDCIPAPDSVWCCVSHKAEARHDKQS